jgi:putative colanic acid biosysnthesis UDP-glucose lipid carrier transferase
MTGWGAEVLCYFWGVPNLKHYKAPWDGTTIRGTVVYQASLRGVVAMTQLAERADLTRTSIVRFLGISYHQLSNVVLLCDAVLIVCASVLGDLGYQYIWYGVVPDVEISFGVGIVASLIYGFLGRSRGLYTLPSLLAPQQRLSPIVLAWSMVFFVLLFVLFLLKVGTIFSRGSMVAFASVGLVLLLVFRLSTTGYLRAAMAKGAIRGRRAVILGDRDELGELNFVTLLHRFGIEEVARVVLSDVQGKGSSDWARNEVAKIDRAIEIARDSGATELVVALHWSSAALLELVKDRLRCSPLPVRLLPDSDIRSIVGRRQIAEGTGFSVELQREPLTKAERTMKRAVDIAVSATVILLMSPLLLLVALAIKLDSPGPVVFRQRRNGFNGRQFVIYKFRTMNVLEDGAVIEQARQRDRRVTLVGRLLRRSSIDELPQLFNVLKGDMSLVGPRPHALAHDYEYRVSIANYAFRHHVKPGITGWAQVNGFRGETSKIELMTERVEADLWYINNWSLWLDLRIMIGTCFEIARARAAY